MVKKKIKAPFLTLCKKCYILFLGSIFFSLSFTYAQDSHRVDESRFIIHEVDPASNKLNFFWKDKEGTIYSSINQLKQSLEKEGKKLVFAMNGGMYQKDQSPQGLYVEQGQLLKKANQRREGYGNFYLQPNGIFYLTKAGKAFIRPTDKFRLDSSIYYATQSGPMLLINGIYHPKLSKDSKNIHIRNGVGILPNGDVLFVLSKERVNFYDLATLFKQKGCKNALYLDGFVSRAYLPQANWEQLDGNFGVIIGEVE